MAEYDEKENQHASSSRWRHQESSAFLQHAQPRDPVANRHSSNDLADFLNSSRVEPPATPKGGTTNPRHVPLVAKTEVVEDGSGVLEVKCGPLLNYRRMENNIWHGSVLIVTKGGGLYDRPAPALILKAGSTTQLNGGIHEAREDYGTVNGVDYSSFQNPAAPNNKENGENIEGTKVTATKLYSDPRNTFWRFDLEIPMGQSEIKCDYTIPGLTFTSQKTDNQSFYIPAISDSMRIMFHSCNGFSVGTDVEAFSGPCLWNDVQRVHKKTPFHVMIGGGDQIYNDGIRVHGPLRPWTDISIPKKRKDFPFAEEMRRNCDDYYVDNYITW